MKITTSLCAVTVAAVLAAANVETVDRRGEAAQAALVASDLAQEELLSDVDRLASGQMTPAERRAFARELAERGKQAREAMRESDALTAAP